MLVAKETILHRKRKSMKFSTVGAAPAPSHFFCVDRFNKQPTDPPPPGTVYLSQFKIECPINM